MLSCLASELEDGVQLFKLVDIKNIFVSEDRADRVAKICHEQEQLQNSLFRILGAQLV